MNRADQAELEEYIAGHADEALEKGWIKVYFQPVVRTLTGRLSSCEALTRWSDPVHGMISPGIFIPVLERTNQIQKVDTYVIDYVAKLLKRLFDEGKELVPVSFNLSRVDFSQADPYEETENAVAKYGINRKFLKVELTESTLISDPVKLERMFTLFHQKGYDIWMDDFGSGYSTLNVLKDYSFDEIKIDMLFLRGLNERGRNIISSIVRMAKSLGIQTLTEGAETREQVDFLRNIGCEKIQGYYYGAPMPYEELLKHCFYFGIIPESLEEAAVYDAAGTVDFLEDKPVALIESKNGDLKFVFENQASEKVLKSVGIKDVIPFFNTVFENKSSGNYYKFSNALKRMHEPGKRETINSVFNGHYLRIYLKLLKKVNEIALYQMAVYDITYDISQKDTRRFNNLLREANDIYKYVYLWSPKEDSVEVISSEVAGENPGSTFFKAKIVFRKIAEERVASDDRDRFLNFMNPVHIKTLLNRTHSNFIGECFKVRNPEGGYSWDEVDVMALKYGNYGDYLILERKSALDDTENLSAVIRRIDNTIRSSGARNDGSDSCHIYQTLLENSKLKFFWKDKDRRFLGVSRAMLNYYGISSASEIIGKTDEEMGWHIDNGPYFDDEMKVIKEGKTIRKSLGHTLVGGQVKIISATKFPLYKNDEIIGLAGFFEEENSVAGHATTGAMTDPVTGFMNFGGFMLSHIYYRDNYIKTKERFTVVYLHLDTDWAEKNTVSDTTRLAKRVALSLSDKFSRDEIICAMDDHKDFIIMTKENVDKVREQISSLAKDIDTIKYIGSTQVKISLSYSMAVSEENIPSDQLIDILKERCDQEKFQESRVGADRFVMELEKIENMDERIYICDMDSYDLIFLNKMAKKDLGLPENFSCQGHKCYELIHHYDHPCNHCTNPVCTRSGFVSHHYHNTLTGHDYLMRDTVIEFGGKSVKLSMSISLTENIHEVVDANNLLYRRVRINDFVGDALEEANPDESLGRMLENIGKEFKADRAYIFEEDGPRISNTYEWCAPGVIPEKDSLQNVPIADAAVFYDEFEKNSSIIIKDVEKYRGTLLYTILESQKIRRLISVPLKENGTMKGFIGIDNPSKKLMDNADLTLNSLARFISALIRNRDVLRTLDDMSHHDQMTGSYNRAALKHVFYSLNPDMVTAVVYADVNGLKKINDKYGHKAGDELIMKAANDMAMVAGMDKVFRMGGDEFVILLELKNMSEVDSKLTALNDIFEKTGISVALGVAVRTDAKDSLDDLLAEADQRMYRNKKIMHQKNI